MLVAVVAASYRATRPKREQLSSRKNEELHNTARGTELQNLCLFLFVKGPPDHSGSSFSRWKAGKRAKRRGGAELQTLCLRACVLACVLACLRNCLFAYVLDCLLACLLT